MSGDRRIAAAIGTRTRDEWGEPAAGTDTCLVPVLTLREVADHPHHRQRETLVMVGETLQPAAALRFSRTVPPLPTPVPTVRSDVRAVLAEWGLTETEATVFAYEAAGAFDDGR